ncbi:MAG TPA: hypothetical protein PLG41_16120 [Leptospiraceae bacterium]|nr:hypothetical protein [Leptospiraceae bacterium]
MKTELEIVQDVSRKLESANILYMLTGSMAMNYYAVPRMTRDIDLVVEVLERNIPMIVNLFEKEYYIESEAIRLAIQSEKLFNAIHEESFIKVDFIIRKSNSYRKEEFSRRQKVLFGNFETYIVSKEDLILSKLVWSKSSKSDMQKRDIKNLINSGYDRLYLDEKAESLLVKDWLEEIKNE